MWGVGILILFDVPIILMISTLSLIIIDRAMPLFLFVRYIVGITNHSRIVTAEALTVHGWTNHKNKQLVFFFPSVLHLQRVMPLFRKIKCKFDNEILEKKVFDVGRSYLAYS